MPASRCACRRTEFELLVYLLRNRGHVLSREQIHRAVWGYEHDPGTNVVDVYIGYLRRKLRRRRRTAPDRHRALGRLPLRCPSLTRSGCRLRRLACFPSLRWRLMAWVAGVIVVLRVSSSSSTRTPAPQLRAQIDRDIAVDTASYRSRSGAPPARRRARSPPPRSGTSQTQPYSATSTLLFVLVPGAPAR